LKEKGQERMLGAKKFAQDSDIEVPNAPADGISSLSMNGNLNMNPTILIATAWDGTVREFAFSIIFFVDALRFR
jgi:hypothetical protein